MTSRHGKGLSSEEISLVMMWRMSLNEYHLNMSVEQLCQMALQGPRGVLCVYNIRLPKTVQSCRFSSSYR